MNTNHTTISNQDIQEGKGLAILAHIWIIGTLAAWLQNKAVNNRFVSKKIREMTVLSTMLIISIYFLELYYMNIVVFISVTAFLMWSYSLINTVRGRSIKMLSFITTKGNDTTVRYYILAGLLALPVSYLFLDKFFKKSLGFWYYVMNLDLLFELQTFEFYIFPYKYVILFACIGLLGEWFISKRQKAKY